MPGSEGGREGRGGREGWSPRRAFRGAYTGEEGVALGTLRSWGTEHRSRAGPAFTCFAHTYGAPQHRSSSAWHGSCFVCHGTHGAHGRHVRRLKGAAYSHQGGIHQPLEPLVSVVYQIPHSDDDQGQTTRKIVQRGMLTACRCVLCGSVLSASVRGPSQADHSGRVASNASL